MLGLFDAWRHDSTAAKMIRLEEKLAEKFDCSAGIYQV